MTVGRLDPARRLIWLAVALTVPYVLVVGGTIAFLPFAETRILLQVLMLATAVMGIVAAARRPELISSPVVAAGAIFVAAMIVSGVFSQRPAATLEAVALLVLSAPCYLAIRAIAWDGPLGARVRWLIVVSAFLVLIPYIVQVLAAWISWWSHVGLTLPPIRPGHAGGTTTNPNALATYTYLLVPYAVWASRSWRRGRWVGGLLIVCAVFALVTSGSRGAWVGAAAGVAVAGLMIAGDRRGLVRQLARPRFAVGAVVGIVAIAVVSPWVLTRVAAGDASRQELWSAAISIFERFPVFGGGPGSWQGLRPLEPIFDADTAALFTSHASILHIAAETGVVGLAAAGVLVGAVVLAGRRAYARASGLPGRRIEVAVVGGSLVALSVHSLVDPQFFLAAVMLMTAYLVARLDEPSQSASADAHRPSRWPLAVAASATAIAALVLIRVDMAMIDGQAGMAAIDRGDWQEALISLDRATATHALGPYELGRAIALSRLGRQGEAAEALERQAASDPLTAPSAGIAVLVENEDPTRAVAAAHVVAEAGAYDPTATLNAAGVLDRRSDPVAVAMLADLLVELPSLDVDPLPAGPASAATWQAAIEAAIGRLQATDPLAAASIALEAGAPERAWELAEAAPSGPDRDLFEMYLAARGGATVDMAAAHQTALAGAAQRAMDWYGRLAILGGTEADRARADVVSRLLFTTGPFETTIVDLGDDPTQRRVRRVLTYPGTSYRLGPGRPYVAGMATLSIEPWSP